MIASSSSFIKSLIPFFSDPRYIRINGAPFIIVYRAQHLPNARKSSKIWRDYCREAGIGEIHICAAFTHGNMDYMQFDFDSGVEFPPHNTKSESIVSTVPFYEPFRGSVVDYQMVAESYLDQKYKHGNVFRTVFPSWDNTARTGNRAFIVHNASPQNYQHWLAESIRKTIEEFPGQDRFVFINAWNEWAEGCHLEPDRKFQHGFLDATLQAKEGYARPVGFSERPELIGGGVPRRTIFGDLRILFAFHTMRFLGQLAGLLKKFPRIRRFIRWIINY